MTLSIHGKERTSVFQLTRDDENSATFALGWVLEKSTQYRQLFLKEIFNEALDAEDTLIELQKHSSGGGFTDIELSGPGFHAILEAKRWWGVSTVEQLEQYAARLASGDAMQKRLISISAADRSYAQRRLPRALQDVEIAHLSWGDLRRLAAKAHALATGFQEKLWLREMMQHLKEFVFVDRQIDNNVFGASLGHEPMVTGKSHTGIDFVEKDRLGSTSTVGFKPSGVISYTQAKISAAGNPITISSTTVRPIHSGNASTCTSTPNGSRVR
jgi:hypothetical protein